LKESVDLTFILDMNREVNSQQNLVFNEGFIILASFNFEGEREVGENVYFSEPFPNGLNIYLNETNEAQELQFEIPQGIYNRIVIEFEILNDFEQGSLVVEGIFTNSVSTEIPIRFEFNSSEIWEIVAEDESGNNQIIINADEPVLAKIELDPIYWFQTVTNSMFENADRITLNDKSTILISKNFNEDIFVLVVDRFDESTRCIFNYSLNSENE